MSNQARYFYRYEAKSIQRYVLASDRLREVKGASAIVEELAGLFKQAIEAQGRGEYRYAAAGGGTATFDSRDAADDFYAHWPMVVAQHAPGLQVVQAIVDLEAVAPASVIDALTGQLTADRSRLHIDLPEAGPIVARAPRSGLPAVAIGDGIRTVARSQVERRRETLFDAAAAASVAAAGGPNGDRLRDRIVMRSSLAGLRFMDDIDDLNARYVAVVHADGNGIGAILRRVTAAARDRTTMIAELTRFSDALKHATEQAVGDAITAALDAAQYPPGRRDGQVFPGRPVVVGGDDMTFVLRSDLALAFVEKYLEVFERETTGMVTVPRETGRPDDPSPPYLTACAGIAFVHQNYPFHLAYDLAYSLCDFTKDTLRHAKLGMRSAMHFHRVTDTVTDKYGTDVLEAQLTTPEEYVLTRGPFLRRASTSHPPAPTIAGLRALAETVADDGERAGDDRTASHDDERGSTSVKVPRSAINDVVQHMAAGRSDLAKDRLLRLREVMVDPVRGPRSRDAWEAFETKMRALHLDLDSGGWGEDAYGRTSTALADVLDLLPVTKWSTKR